MTVHFVDTSLDGGPIIAQVAGRRCCRATTRARSTRESSAKSTACLPRCGSALGGGSAVVPRSASWWSVPSNSYDLVVLGDDLAALVCATLCARRGMRTLVLGSRSPCALHARPAQAADRARAVAGRPGVGRRARAQGAARRDGAAPQAARAADRRAAGRARPPHRPRRRSPRRASSRARSATAGEAVARALGSAAASVARLLDPLLAQRARVPRRRLLRAARGRQARRARQRGRRRVVDGRRDRPARARCGATSPRSRCAIPAPPPAAIARAVDAWRAGPPSLRGDGDAIRELLVEKLTTAGGELRAGTVTELERVVGQDRRASRSQNGDEIGAGQVVASRPPSELAELLGKKAPKRLAELAESVAARRLSLHAQHRHRRGRHPRAHGADRRGDRAIPTRIRSATPRSRSTSARPTTPAASSRRSPRCSPSDGPIDAERLAAEVHGAARRPVEAARRRDAVLREATSCSRTRRSRRRRRRSPAAAAATTCRATCRSRCRRCGRHGAELAADRRHRRAAATSPGSRT